MATPEHLYHYTTQHGLLGILENKKLWLTNIYFLNDSTEFIHTIDLVKEQLLSKINTYPKGANLKSIPPPTTIPGGSIKGKIYDMYVRINDILNKIVIDERLTSYIFSLSEKCNDLNQYRGYTNDGMGFCLEFDMLRFKSIIDNADTLSIDRCCYTNTEKRRWINIIIDEVENNINSNIKSESDTLDEFILHLLFIAPQIKHEAFELEEEWRVFTTLSKSKIKQREGKSTIIPYIELPIIEDDGRLPITKIFFGPTLHPELAKYSVKSILSSNNIKDIEIIDSKIPYRTW